MCTHYCYPMHMHTKPLKNLDPYTCFLGSEPTFTFIHSSANESIKWFHSFHFCQTQSISLFLPVLTEQQGTSEIEGRKGGLKHPDSSKTPHLFSSLVTSECALGACGSVYVPHVCEIKQREGIKKDEAEVYAWYPAFLSPFVSLRI